MDINDLTLGQIKELRALLNDTVSTGSCGSIDAELLGKKVIVRTYSAGAWFGLLYKKSGEEVLLKNARRLWKFKAVNGICLSDVAMSGVNQAESRVSVATGIQWLKAIEIIPCKVEASKLIEEAKNAKP